MKQKVELDDVLKIIEKVAGAVGNVIGTSLPIVKQLDQDLTEIKKPKSKSRPKPKKKSR